MDSKALEQILSFLGHPLGPKAAAKKQAQIIRGGGDHQPTAAAEMPAAKEKPAAKAKAPRQKAAPWLEDDELDGMSGSLSGGCDTGTFMSA